MNDKNLTQLDIDNYNNNIDGVNKKYEIDNDYHKYLYINEDNLRDQCTNIFHITKDNHLFFSSSIEKDHEVIIIIDKKCDVYVNSDIHNNGFHCVFFIHQDSKLQLLTNQRTDNLSIKFCFYLYNNAILKHLHNLKIDTHSNNLFEYHLLGDNSKCYVNNAIDLSHRSVNDTQIKVFHEQSNTQSFIKCKSLLNDESDLSFDCNVIVNSNLKNIHSEQVNNNILKTPNCRIKTIPQMNIKSKDINVSHSVTIQYVDKNIVRYVQSRGMIKEVFNELLYKNYFHELSFCDR